MYKKFQNEYLLVNVYCGWGKGVPRKTPDHMFVKILEEDSNSSAMTSKLSSYTHVILHLLYM